MLQIQVHWHKQIFLQTGQLLQEVDSLIFFLFI